MNDTQVITTVKKDLSWLQQHERIIIVFMVLLAGAWGWNHYVDSSAAKAGIVAALSEQRLNDQKAANKDLATQSQSAATIYQQTIAIMADQNTKLAAAVTARNAALGRQQATNNTAPLPDVAKRWSMLTGIAGTEIAAGASGITVSDSAARTTVNELEKVPVLTANLADAQQSCKNTQTELDKADGLIGTLNPQIAGLNKQIAAADNACQAKIDLVNKDARKGKLAWFKGGVVVGFISGLFLGHKIP